jgi:hypothetical protein
MVDWISSGSLRPRGSFVVQIFFFKYTTNKDTRIAFARQIKRVCKSNGRKTAPIIYANTPWCPGTRKIGWALQVTKRRDEAAR